MRLFLVLAFALTGLCLPACTKSSPAPTSRVTQLVGGADQVSILQQPDTVTVQRLKQDAGDTDIGQAVGPAQTISLPRAKELSDILLDDATYFWAGAKGCDPMPGVLVTYESNGKRAEIRICYECMMLGFAQGHWEDFDDRYDQLVAWGKQVFPDDPEIQGL